jgi:Asp-tRNA(Asn)/Glu-tRNA(Gln) amidotransferase A subunit family amidase
VDPRTASIRSIRDKLAERRLTCAETVSIYLDRIKEIDPSVEAFITITTDEARAHADELDREIAEGRPLRPLHGVPYTLKDVFATKGSRQRWRPSPPPNATMIAAALGRGHGRRSSRPG